MGLDEVSYCHIKKCPKLIKLTTIPGREDSPIKPRVMLVVLPCDVTGHIIYSVYASRFRMQQVMIYLQNFKECGI